MKFLDRSGDNQLPPKHNETEKFLERQQNIDALLVLTKVCEPGMIFDVQTVKKAESKISNLIDKI